MSYDHAEPATKEGKREARALGQQVKESEDFLRRRGNEAPAVVALSFLSAAVSALAPLVMVRAGNRLSLLCSPILCNHRRLYLASMHS